MAQTKCHEFAVNAGLNPYILRQAIKIMPKSMNNNYTLPEDLKKEYA